MLKLKLQYYGHLMKIIDSLEKTLMFERLKAEGEGADRIWDGWMASLTQWIWVWVSSGYWLVIDREAWRAAVHGIAKNGTELSDWNEVEEFPLILLEVFIMNESWNLSNAFYAYSPNEMIMWFFLQYFKMFGHIVWFLKVEIHRCDKSHLIVVYIYFIHFWIWFGNN